jgi:hypothetical protein
MTAGTFLLTLLAQARWAARAGLPILAGFSSSIDPYAEAAGYL